MSANSFAPPNSFLPVYLVELFSPVTGELLEADVSGSIQNAVTAAVEHAKSFSAHEVSGIDVQFRDENPDKGIDGIAFFTGEDSLLVCISRYELDNEEVMHDCAGGANFAGGDPCKLRERIALALACQTN